VRDARISPPVRAKTPATMSLGREIVETVVLTAVIFLAVHLSVQPFRVDGPSMQPGLHTNDLVIVNLLTYHFTSPQRGDIYRLPPAD